MNNNIHKKKFIIVTTVPASLFFFRGQVGVLKEKFDVEVASGSGERLTSFCEMEKVHGHLIPRMEREISIFNDIHSLFKLIQLFNKIKPEVVHGNTPKGGLLSMLASWICGVKTRIYCVHGLRYQGAKGFKRKLLMFLERMSCKLATHVFTVSFGVMEIMKNDKIIKDNVNIIWNGSVNGIDIDYFSPDSVDETALKEKYKFNENHLIFGFVGRLVKDKGVNELVASFLKINEKYPHTRLLLVGRFEDADPITKEMRHFIETHKNIISCGNQEDVRPYLKLMDIFTFASYREGFGVSLMEAAAMNIPAISSNITGCNEIIQDGYNGKLISSKSIDELYDMMEYFILNPEEIKKMASVSRQYVIDKYEQKKLWTKALEKYNKITSDV